MSDYSKKALIQKLLKKGGESGGRKEIDWFSLPKDTTEVHMRIIPYAPLEEGDYPIRPVIKHFNLPGVQGARNCPRMHGEECPVCDVYFKYLDKFEEGALKDYKAATFMYCNALIKNVSGVHANEIKIVQGPFSMLQFIDEMYNAEGGGNLFSLTHGRDFFLKRERAGGKYKFRPAFTESAIASSEDEIESIMSKVVDLDKMWTKVSDDDLNILGEAAREIEDMLKNKLMMPDGTSETPKETRRPSRVETREEPKEEKVETPREVVKKVETKKVETKKAEPVVEAKVEAKAPPKNSPACYGFRNSDDATKKEKGITLQKCNMCPFEFKCENIK